MVYFRSKNQNKKILFLSEYIHFRFLGLLLQTINKMRQKLSLHDLTKKILKITNSIHRSSSRSKLLREERATFFQHSYINESEVYRTIFFYSTSFSSQEFIIINFLSIIIIIFFCVL